jgi:hypothetical protein
MPGKFELLSDIAAVKALFIGSVLRIGNLILGSYGIVCLKPLKVKMPNWAAERKPSRGSSVC